ncbi:hypothetical protein ZOSMA_33G00090 [Zostera marina]|uniref:Uncharacterized protein n=1 Tax=Zostera marina TaxID=29655 RepID=A0A0K9P7G4_ZOSMR|nr:hypothetical protein ZOSMA_33G00090 [Zostera marina]
MVFERSFTLGFHLEQLKFYTLYPNVGAHLVLHALPRYMKKKLLILIDGFNYSRKPWLRKNIKSNTAIGRKIRL